MLLWRAFCSGQQPPSCPGGRDPPMKAGAGAPACGTSGRGGAARGGEPGGSEAGLTVLRLPGNGPSWQPAPGDVAEAQQAPTRSLTRPTHLPAQRDSGARAPRKCGPGRRRPGSRSVPFRCAPRVRSEVRGASAPEVGLRAQAPGEPKRAVPLRSTRGRPLDGWAVAVGNEGRGRPLVQCAGRASRSRAPTAAPRRWPSATLDSLSRPWTWLVIGRPLPSDARRWASAPQAGGRDGARPGAARRGCAAKRVPLRFTRAAKVALIRHFP